MIVWEIDRLPYLSEPGFDCIGDHANCPVCKEHGEQNHGIAGGQSWFGVRTMLPDGRWLAAVLCVLRADYPASARARAELPQAATGAYIKLHTQGDATECRWVPGGRCSDDVSRGEISFVAGAELYAKHGTPDGGPEQPEQLWGALGKWLVSQAEIACGMAQP